jgi:hypothetical protein
MGPFGVLLLVEEAEEVKEGLVERSRIAHSFWWWDDSERASIVNKD